MFGSNNSTLLKGISTKKGIVTGKITNADLEVNELGIQSIQDLVKAIENGETYINIITEQNPDGELRGQIELLTW